LINGYGETLPILGI